MEANPPDPQESPHSLPYRSGAPRVRRAVPIPRALDVRDFWLILLLAAVTAGVLSPVLRHRFIESWDDRTAILTNPDYNPPRLKNLLHYWTSPASQDNFYVPVTYTLWGLLAIIAGDSPQPGWTLNPAYFYAANLVAHTFSAVVVFLILRRLIPNAIAVFIGSALFALHPIQVEAVANAWSVYTPLSAFFGFVAIWQYLAFSDRHAINPGKRARGWPNYLLATVAFLMAMLTKPTAVSVPLIIVVLEVGLRGRTWRQVGLPLGAWLLVVPATIWINRHSSPGSTVFRPEPLLLPLVPLDAIAFYMGKILVPIHLVMDYGRSPKMVAGTSPIRFTSLITLALALAVWLTRRRWPLGIVVFGVFIAGMLPTIGIVPFGFQIYSTVADRYVYISMLAPALMFSALVAKFPTRRVVGSAAIVLAVLATASVHQLRHWQEDWGLIDYTLETNPRSMAPIAMFRVLYDQFGPHFGLYGPVPASFRCTLSSQQLVRDAEILDQRKFYQLSAACYRQALIQGPRTAGTYALLAEELQRGDEPAEARKACVEALRLEPNNLKAQETLQKLEAAGFTK